MALALVESARLVELPSRTGRGPSAILWSTTTNLSIVRVCVALAEFARRPYHRKSL